jgi:hypothetical protein
LHSEKLHTSYSSPNILGRSNQGESGGRDIWHAWERKVKSAGFLVGNPEGKSPRRRWEDAVRMDLRLIGWRVSKGSG